MEVVCSFETLVPTYKPTRSYNPNQHPHLHRHGNLKFHISYMLHKYVSLIGRFQLNRYVSDQIIIGWLIYIYAYISYMYIICEDNNG